MRYLSRLTKTLVTLALFAGSGPLMAHEFWIDTQSSAVGVGETLSAQLRVGQDFSGTALPYLDTTVKAMTLVSPTGSHALAARLGDLPAIPDVTLHTEGLHVLAVETNPSYIVFDDMPAFNDYLDYEGLAAVADLHRGRGLPDSEIAEAYIRNARALVQVGPAGGGDADQPTGLPFEIRVTQSPFVAGQRALSVRLEWRGTAVPGAQIALFHVPSGGTAPADTVRTLATTDDAGHAEFAMPGAGKYLLNAVRMAPVEGPGSVVWQSHWASLTFLIERTP